MNYYVYVIGSKKEPVRTYIGWTINLKRRILKHNLGVGAKFTRGRKWKILYTETLNSKSEAMRREYQLKRNTKLRSLLRSQI